MKKFWNWVLSLFGKKPDTVTEPETDDNPVNVQTDSNPADPEDTEEASADSGCGWDKTDIDAGTEPDSEPATVPDNDMDTDENDGTDAIPAAENHVTAPGITAVVETTVEIQDTPAESNLQSSTQKSIMLSPHFSLHELTNSATAKRYGINNTPGEAQTANLVLLCQKVLEPIRTKYGKPIVVSSGFRCAALNKKVGGASTSQHVTGQAADIHSVSDTLADNLALYNLIVKSGIVFDQLIYEYGNSSGPDWIHISFNGKGNRRQKLKASKVNSKTVYTVIK